MGPIMPKNSFYILLFVVCFSILSCHKTISEADKQLYAISRHRYYLAESNMFSRVYKQNDGSVVELPLLPKGLFLTYEPSSMFDSGNYPLLDFQGRREDVEFFPLSNVISIDIYRDVLIAYKLGGKVYKIDYDKPFDGVEIDSNFVSQKEKLLEHYDFEEIDNEFPWKFTHVLGIQDNFINIGFMVGYSTPILRGITETIVLKKGKNYYLSGKTIYSFFSFNIKSGITYFFFNESDYQDFISNCELITTD